VEFGLRPRPGPAEPLLDLREHLPDRGVVRACNPMVNRCNSCRKQGKRGNILALQPLHRTARNRSAGELLRYRSGDAALAIARMPTRITSGPDGQDGGY
jgi:hypothetical protein